MSNRFEFALRKIQGDQWQIFENLSSQFLAEEFTELRTLAAPEGDRGRDAHLYAPTDDDSVAIQYSVSSDWAAKITGTVRRLKKSFPDVAVLIYTSPHAIGARGDSLRKSLRVDAGIHLDIRDRAWFIERESQSPTTIEKASWFTNVVAGEILREEGLIDRTGTVLSGEENRAALLYLVLQREDDDLDRHLTKQCYDALVRAVLRNTDSENRKHRSAIHVEIHAILPSHSETDNVMYVDLALTRMNKRFTRHWAKDDEYCLTHAERVRLDEGIAKLKMTDDEFQVELLQHANFVASGLDIDLSMVSDEAVAIRIRRVLDAFLLTRGEAFVESLHSGQVMMFVETELESLTESDLASNADTTSLRGAVVPLVTQTVERVLLSSTDVVRSYLRSIGDAYTLLAFLRETPNVQSAVSKLFAHGDFWLDTSVILPLMAEDLLAPSERSNTRLLRAVIAAGGHLYVTRGVIDEISSHIANSLAASRSPGTWNSRTPFLLASFTWSGGEVADFSRWIETFRGAARPADDLEEYLAEEHSIIRHDLVDEAATASDVLRWQADAHWREIHEQRRSRNSHTKVNPETIELLTSHDVENFVGVIQRRTSEPVGHPFGYASWWLTLDKKAFDAARAIGERCDGMDLPSPVLSLDFLTHYLAVGPARKELNKDEGRQLPLITDNSLIDALPTDLLDSATEVRRTMQGQDERVIRRRIRDHLDTEKLRDNRVGKTTIEALEDDIRIALEASR